MKEIAVITLFPEMFAAMTYGIPGRAQQKGLLKINYYNPRDFAMDVHRTVDDRPFGGGPGMVMKAEPLYQALKLAQSQQAEPGKVVYLAPFGKVLAQDTIKACAVSPRSMVLIAGRYEGIDQRFLQSYVDEVWSIGDYVLSGGELPAMVVLDALARWLPGAVGDSQSVLQDAFSEHPNRLDHPHYTRPQSWQGVEVPSALCSGDHQAIDLWKKKQVLGQTWLHRPDLLQDEVLDASSQRLLDAFKSELNS